MAKQKFDKKFIKDVASEINRLVIERMDKIAINVHNAVSIATPVDLGQAWAGWNFTLNKESSEIPKAPLKAKKGQSRIVLSRKPSTPDQKAKAIGDSYFISNAVKHIVYLNEGSSKKAAPNFIEIETARAVRDAERQL